VQARSDLRGRDFSPGEENCSISDFTGCGKIPKMSFRGRGLPEGSAFFLGLAKKQIPRFARDDIKLLFFAASLAAEDSGVEALNDSLT
jgi:hypothetical protein